jgi:hypothetical protein
MHNVESQYLMQVRYIDIHTKTYIDSCRYTVITSYHICMDDKRECFGPHERKRKENWCGHAPAIRLAA